MENLIDLRKYPQHDVELIAREFLRVVYIDACQDYAKEVEKSGAEDTTVKNIGDLLMSIEKVIIMLDGNDEFLKYVTGEPDGNKYTAEEDAEYDRF